ncbi:MAG: hypothetical protein M3495_07880, partial [Pseudomonadota bacterium]|nr:hypothetical protein [Pseudomonadota bacterium]
MAARLAKAERGASAADELIGGSSITDLRIRRQPDTADWGCALLAGTQLLEIGLGAIHKSERARDHDARGRLARRIVAGAPGRRRWVGPTARTGRGCAGGPR